MIPVPGDPPVPGLDVEVRVVAAVIAAAIAAAGLVIASGAISAAVLGRGWVWPATNEWGQIAARLLAHPGHPGAAWPPVLARRIPGPTAYWTTYATLGLLVVVTAAACWRAISARRPGAGQDGMARAAQLHHEASATAARRRRAITRAGLASTDRPKATEFGYPLGRSLRGGIPLWASWESSTRVIGPPGGGKTFRILARILRHHPGPAIATSTKADLFELTADARADHGPIAVFDPTLLLEGTPAVRWSPVQGCQDSVVAERRAGALLAAAGDTDDSRNGAFFGDTARDVLKCYLHAAALSGGDIRTVLGWSRRMDDPTPDDILRTEPGAAPGWAGIVKVHTTGADETTSGVMRHLARALACFSHPHVIDMCCPAPDRQFDIAQFLKAKGTVYLLGKDSGLGAVAPLLTAFAEEVFDQAERLANREKTRRLDPPLLGLLDEVTSIAPIPTLPGLLADGRGRGITIVYAMQSFSQAVTRWGPSRAETMGNATNITVVFGGLNSAKDLSDLERICGTRLVRRDTLHYGQGRATQTATRSWEQQPVLTVARIRTLLPGRGLVLWGSLPPVIARFPKLSADRRDWKAIQAGRNGNGAKP